MRSKFLAVTLLLGLLTACPTIPANIIPLVAIQSPISNTTINQNSIAVTGVASDDKGISKIEYQINGATKQPATGTSNWSFNATNLVQGNNSIQVFATDTENAVGSSQVNVIYAINPNPQNTPPTLVIQTPTDNSTINQNSIVVSGTAADNGSIASVQYSLNGATRQNAIGTATWNFTASNLVVGNNVMTVYAKDNENSETQKVINVTYTTPAPNTFALNVNKTGSGNVNSVLAGITCGTDCSENYTAGTNITLTAIPDTRWNFKNWAGACTGTNLTCTFVMTQNQSVFANFELIPDTTPPSINISSPSGNTINASIVTVSGTAADNVSVTQVQYSLNGAARVNAVGTINWIFQIPTLDCGVNSIIVYAKDTSDLETASSTWTVTRNCGSFSLSPVSSNIIIAQGSDALYFLNLTAIAPFNTLANALSSLTASGVLVGMGASQVRVFYRPELSSATQAAFVLKAGASVPLGAQSITINATGGGVNAPALTLNFTVVACSSGC